MKSVILFVFCYSIVLVSANSQSYLYTDLGNNILTRANLGYEYKFKNMAVGGSLQHMRMAQYWVYEFGGFFKTKGAQLDLYHRFIAKNIFYLESKIRLQSVKGPELINGWKSNVIYTDRTKIEFAEKVGFLIEGKKRKMFLDFGIGPAYGNTNAFLDVPEVDKDFQPYTIEKLYSLYPNPNKRAWYWAPHIQVKLYYRLKK